MLRSTTTMTGLDCGAPAEPCCREPGPAPAKRLSLESRRWSRSLRSSFVAMISAAPPLGHLMIGMAPPEPSVSWSTQAGRTFARTHGDGDAEEADDDPVDELVELVVLRLRAVERPVRPLPETQVEEVRLGDDEVEVLVVELRDVLRRAGRRRLRRKILQQWSRDRVQEIDVGRRVQIPREVLRDELQVPAVGLDEVYDRHVRDRVSTGVDVP